MHLKTQVIIKNLLDYCTATAEFFVFVFFSLFIHSLLYLLVPELVATEV